MLTLNIKDNLIKYLLLLFIICFAGCGEDDSDDVTSIASAALNLTLCDGKVTKLITDDRGDGQDYRYQCVYALDNNQIYLFSSSPQFGHPSTYKFIQCDVIECETYKDYLEPIKELLDYELWAPTSEYDSLEYWTSISWDNSTILIEEYEAKPNVIYDEYYMAYPEQYPPSYTKTYEIFRAEYTLRE